MKKVIAITLIFSILFCPFAQSVAQAQNTDAGITHLYQSFIQSAQESFNRGDYAQARDYYQAALELKPENAEYINSKIAGIDLIIQERERQRAAEAAVRRQEAEAQRQEAQRQAESRRRRQNVWTGILLAAVVVLVLAFGDSESAN